MPARRHDVRRGDTLWRIAARYYGNPLLWPQIFAANRDQLVDPNLIIPGTQLRVPERR